MLENNAECRLNVVEDDKLMVETTNEETTTTLALIHFLLLHSAAPLARLSSSLQTHRPDDSNKTSISFIGALQAVSSFGLSFLGSFGGCLSLFEFRAAVKMSMLLRQGYRLVFSDVRFRPPGQLAWASLKTRPPAIQKIYDKLEHLEESIDQEAKPGANLPFSVEKPRALALKIILFIGIAFNMPFYIIYRHMRKAAAT
nr:unnamed protein product [Spirometra erinaceieuropaei]